jgi:hypothetical protein
MQSSSFISLSILFLVTLHGLVESKTTSGPDDSNKGNQCAQYSGARYNFVDAKAVALLSEIVPTVERDPIPCCSLCHQTLDCDAFSYEINNGDNAVCNLYTLPQSLASDFKYFGHLKRIENTDNFVGFSYDFIQVRDSKDSK